MTECTKCEDWDRKKKVCLKNLTPPCGQFSISWQELKLPQPDYLEKEDDLPEKIEVRRKI